MTPSPRGRPWFQLHLSTCIVLMLAAGAMVGANLVPSKRAVVYVTSEFWWAPYADYREGEGRSEGYGWPQTCRVEKRTGTVVWNPSAVAGNFFVGVAILTLTALAFEWRIRRRADDEAEFRESIG